LELPRRGLEIIPLPPATEHPPPESWVAALGQEGAPELRIVRGEIGFLSEMRFCLLRSVREDASRNRVHHSPQRVRAEQNAGGPANDLHALRETGLDGGSVLFAPGVVLQAKPVIEHEHAPAGHAAHHRLSDLLAAL